MLKPFLVVLQKELLGATNPGEETRELGHEVWEFSASEDWKRRLEDLEGQLAISSICRPVLFVSLDVARYVMRHLPHLRRGLLLDPERLKVHRWSGFLAPDLLLNRSFILLPFGSILARKAQIERLFGPRVFLRPDSAMKEFPGFSLQVSDLDREISAATQIWRPDADLLCVIDKAQVLPPHEYRFWMADGQVLSHAPYAFGPSGVHETLEPGPCPDLVIVQAQKLARDLEFWENPVVADLALDAEGVPRLVEINGFSTSGFYPGMHLTDLLAGLDPILIG